MGKIALYVVYFVVGTFATWICGLGFILGLRALQSPAEHMPEFMLDLGLCALMTAGAMGYAIWKKKI